MCISNTSNGLGVKLQVKSNVSGENVNVSERRTNRFVRSNLNGSLTFNNSRFTFNENLQNSIALFNFKRVRESVRECEEMVNLRVHESFGCGSDIEFKLMNDLKHVSIKLPSITRALLSYETNCNAILTLTKGNSQLNVYSIIHKFTTIIRNQLQWFKTSLNINGNCPIHNGIPINLHSVDNGKFILT
ncbi:MAG: hypothetical protein ACTS4X_00385 [Candidatus Hodgkinia cicadicola]